GQSDDQDHQHRGAAPARDPRALSDDTIQTKTPRFAPRGFCFSVSFRGGPQDRTRNLEIPGLVLAHHPGMTLPRQFTSICKPSRLMISPNFAVSAATKSENCCGVP